MLDPVIGGALIEGGASLLGNLLGFGSNSSTNKTNMAINKMNNAFNAAEAEKMRQWQQQEWNRQFGLTNEYNSAAAQRQRLEEAGLNPYLMMSGGSAGTAVSQSGMSGSAASAAPPLSMQSWRPDLSSISNIGDIIAQGDVRSATVSKLGADKNLAEAQALQALGNVDWSKMTEDARKALREQGVARAELGLAREQQELGNLKAQGDLMRSQMALNLLDAEAKQVMNKYMDEQQRSELSLKAAYLYQAVASGDLSREKLETELATQVKLYAEANGQRISNQVAKHTADGIINATNASNGYYDSYYQGKKRWSEGEAATEYLDKYYGKEQKRKNVNWYDPRQGSGMFNDVLQGMDFMMRSNRRFRPIIKPM